MSTERKSYRQVCPMATALDIVGERWTLLILRELLGGPARYVDLFEGLPGIARNLLSVRLKQLESDGIARRVGRGRGALYTLTPAGEAVRPALEALGYWGARQVRVGPPEHGRSIRAVAMALQAIFVHAGRPMPDTPVAVELSADGAPLDLRLGPRPAAVARPCVDAAARVRTTRAALDDVLAGRAPDASAFVLVSGDAGAHAAALAALGVPAR